MSDSVRPHRWQPTRLPRPWDSPGKNTGVGCHFLLQCRKVKSESEVSRWCLTRSSPMDCSLPGSSVHGFSRQEYWSRVPLPSPCQKLRVSVYLSLIVLYLDLFVHDKFSPHYIIKFLRKKTTLVAHIYIFSNILI